MKRSSVFLFAAVLGCLLVAGAGATAGPITWNYSGAGGAAGGGEVVLVSGPGDPHDFQDGVNVIAVPLASGAGSVQMAGSSNITVVKLQTFFYSDFESSFFYHAGYQLSLFLADDASHAWRQLFFTGMFNGWFSPTQAHITSTFTGPTTQTLSLGKNLYTVTIGPYVPPGPPSTGQLGSFGAHVAVQPSGVKPTPEPSTMALAGLGLACCGLWAGRRWQSRRRMALGLS